ncbi:MAG: hypothetical protein OXP71_10260 [Candidatus Poribacteria bacterium]|nr:hypothetical protein [Candidatus Poribacteria bacterium]
MRDAIRKTFHCARHPSNQPYTAIVAVCSFIFALALSFAFKEHLQFLGEKRVNELTEVVGWVSVNNYPKRQEIVNYIAAAVFVPLFTISACGFWIGVSTLCSVWAKQPQELILRQHAFPFLLLLLTLEKGYLPETHLGTVGIPLLLCLFAKGVLLAFNLIVIKRIPAENGVGFAMWAKENLRFHAIPIASGVCLAVFLLIRGSPKDLTPLQCWELLLFSVIGTWILWIGYSALLSGLAGYRFADVLRWDALTFFPTFLLLLLAVLFEIENAATILAIIAAAAFVVLKILVFLQLRSPANSNSLDPHIAVSVLTVIMISGLIYVFLYDSNVRLNHAWHTGGIDLFHEGERVGVVNELIRGEIAYRDIRILHGLFHNAYKSLLGMKLFGETIESDRRIYHLVYPLGYVAFYLLALQFFRRRIAAHFFTLIFIFIAIATEVVAGVTRAYLPASDRQIFGFLTMALLCCWLNKGVKSGNPFLIAAGICTSLAVFNSLDVGLYTWAASSLFLLLYGFIAIRRELPETVSPNKILKLGRLFYLSPLLIFKLGVLIGFLPFLIYFGAHGAIDDAIEGSWIQTVYHIPIFGTPFIAISPELSKVTSLVTFSEFILSRPFMWYFPILIYLMTLTYLLFHAIANRGRIKEWKLLLILLAGIICFRTALGRSDWHHITFSLAYLWLICFYFIERFLRKTKPHRLEPPENDANDEMANAAPSMHRSGAGALRFAFLLVILAGVLSYIKADLYKPLAIAERTLIRLPRFGAISPPYEAYVQPNIERAGRILTPPAQAQEIEKVVSYIQENTAPTDPIFDLSNQAAYYFLADRPNPTRYPLVVYASPEPLQKEVIADLERAKPKYVIFTTGSGWGNGPDGIQTVDRVPLVTAYIRSNYETDVKIESVSIWKRRSG